MDTIWLVSYFVLWLIVILLTLATILLARQVSLLYRRLGPAPARMENEGPDVDKVPGPVAALTLVGLPVTIGGLRDIPQLLVFVSANCLTCEALTPAIRTVWKRENDIVEILTVCMTPDEALARTFIKRNKLYEVPCIATGELGHQYRIQNPPYGVLLNREGVVITKGVVNNLDHIESLLSAAETGHASAQSYFQTFSSDQVVAAD